MQTSGANSRKSSTTGASAQRPSRGFSLTVRSMNSDLSSATYDRPIRARACSGVIVVCPSMAVEPASGLKTPASSRRIVDFPAPLAPSRAATCPDWTLSDTSETTGQIIVTS